MRVKLKTCPTCGKPGLKLVVADYTASVGKKSFTAKSVERYECPHCGEILFDYDGVKKLEEARQPRRKMKKSA